MKSIKVKIGLRPNGHADHPDWQKLPMAKDKNPDNEQIIKWKYDKTSGHDDATEDSPRGMQWGMMVVTDQFAKEAVETFPKLVTIMTDAEAEDFWDNKAHGHMPKYKIDKDELEGLRAELDLKERLKKDTKGVKEQIEKALDPENNQPGIRPLKKSWKETKKSL